MNNIFKTLISIIVFIFISKETMSQNLNIQFKDGTNKSFSVDDIKKQTFVYNMLQLHMKNGSVFSWAISSIKSMLYDNPTQIMEHVVDNNIDEIQLFPIPANEILNIVLNLKNENNLTLIISDMQGKKVFWDKINHNNEDTLRLKIDISEFPSGIYALSIIGRKNRINKKIIKL